MWDFHVGQEVVCVDASHTTKHNEQELVRGKIYKIRWVGLSEHPVFGGNLSIKVEGMVRPVRPDLVEMFPELADVPFRATRFRPLVEKKTSIAIFEKMLIPNKLEPVD